MRFETIAIHTGERPDRTYGAISIPIYQTSTFVFEDVGKTKGYDYSRTANPTRKVLEDTIKPNTRMLWLETPSNPLLNITDIEMTVDVARKHNLLTAIDNTFATPYFLRPIEYGIDLIVH